MKDSQLYQDWLKKAAEDELAAKILLEDGPFSPVCFHSQQMAEKFLKALLLFHGRVFPKIHDLVALGKLIEPMFPEIRDLKIELESLGMLYMQTRYPADYPEFTKSEAEEALEHASRVKNFVTKKIGI